VTIIRVGLLIFAVQHVILDQQWLLGKKSSMPFKFQPWSDYPWCGVNQPWSDYYICMTNIGQFSKKNKSAIVYPGCPSVLKPVLHDAENPVPIPPMDSNTKNDESTDEADVVLKPKETIFMKKSLIRILSRNQDKPGSVTQADLKDHIRDAYALLLRMQMGYTNYMCFYASGKDKAHYEAKSSFVAPTLS